MPRLNNKDFTVDELERMIYLLNMKIDQKKVNGEGFDGVDCEIVELLRGTTLTEVSRELQPIIWNFTFKMAMHPESFKQSEIIKNAMRSKEVMESIESRFRQIVYEELNWYQDRVKIFAVKGDSNILE